MAVENLQPLRRRGDHLPPQLWLEWTLQRIAALRDNLPEPPMPLPPPRPADAAQTPQEEATLATRLAELADAELVRRGLTAPRNASVAERLAIAFYGKDADAESSEG